MQCLPQELPKAAKGGVKFYPFRSLRQLLLTILPQCPACHG